MAKKDELSEFGKTLVGGKSTPITPVVMEFLEDEVPTLLAMGLQEIYDAGFTDGQESRTKEVDTLKEELQTLKKKVEAIINALG